MLESPAGPPARPATVTVAYALQLALVGTLLVGIGAWIAGVVRYDSLIDQAARAAGADPADVSAEHAGNLAGALIGIIPALLLVVWLGVTVAWLRHGSEVARILSLVGLATPVALGLLFCVVGGMFGLFFSLLAPWDDAYPEEVPDDGAYIDTSDGSSDFYTELYRLSSDGWYVTTEATGMIATAVALPLAVATGVLLLTGTSNRYFRPPPPVRYHPAFPQYYPAPYPHYGYQPVWYATPPNPPPYPPPPPPSSPSG